MSISNLPLMKAIGAKVDYLNMRESVIARNIANADTPGYQSRDLKKVDFAQFLNLSSSTVKPVTMSRTSAGHIDPSADATLNTRNNADKLSYEVSPDKNGVILEEQMIKAAQVKMDYTLLLNLSSKQSSMYKTALGNVGA